MIRSILILSTLLGVMSGPGGSNKHNWAQQFNPEKSAKQSQYILSRKVAPRVYIIELDPDFLGEKFTFTGNSTNIFEVLKPTAHVTVHKSRLLDIDKKYTEVIHTNGTIQKPVEQTWTSFNDFYIMRFDPKLAVGNYSLKMKWSGQDANEDPFISNIGFYRAVDKDENGTLKYLVTTHFEPNGARNTFPCWDEPGLKAQFEIIIKHMPNYTAVSNMPIKSQTQLADGRVSTQFERSPKMSPYLPCLAVADYKKIENEHKNISFYSEERYLNSLKFALEVSTQVIPAMELYTGMPYPLPKMDQITIPQYSATAMEHWGLVSYVTTSVQIEEMALTEDLDGKDGVSLLVAHELAHQWFGNLVTPVWWDDIWLNEAFAAYFQYKIIDLMYPDRRIMDEFVFLSVNSAFRADEYTSWPQGIKWTPYSKVSILEMFSPVTYAKGSAVLHMLCHIIGEDVFQTGIRQYLKMHQFGAVTSNDLFDDLQEAYDKKNRNKPLNITETMEPWLTQTGYPLLTVTRDYKTGNTQVSQFDVQWKIMTNKWRIPLNYATKSNPDFSSTAPLMWIERTDKNTTIPNVPKDDWIILNVQQTGFYKVEYDKENWRRISEFLDSDDYDKIPVINRAQLISDAFKFYKKNNYENIDVLINITAYLHRETEFLPWSAMENIIWKFRKLMNNTPEEKIMMEYLRFLIEKVVNKVGFQDQPQESYLIRKTRRVITALTWQLHHPDCMAAGQQLFDKYWNSDSRNKIDINSAIWVFCGPISEANETMLDLFMDNKMPVIMDCIKNTKIRDKYIMKLMSKNAPSDVEKVFRVFDSLFASTKTNFEYGMNYFMNHFTAIEKYFDDNDDSYRTLALLAELVNGIKSQDQLEKFQALLQPQMVKIEAVSDSIKVQKLLELIQKNIKSASKLSSKFHELMDSRLIALNIITPEKKF